MGFDWFRDRAKPIAVYGCLAMVSGCATVGPDYAAPDAAWLDHVETDLYGEAVTLSPDGAEDISQWWTRFNDPVLDSLMVEARKENPGLRIAALRILESRALAESAGATLYPQSQTISADAAYVQTDNETGDEGFSTWSAGFGIGWELDFWGKFQRGIESADAAYFASVANQRDAQVLLTAQVADLYWRYRTIELRIDVLNDNAAQQRRSFDITRQMFEAGQQSELDLQQAKTQYLGTLSSLPALEQARLQLRNAISALLGRAPSDLAVLTPIELPLPVGGTLLTDALPAALIQQRPDVRASLWQVAAQSAQIGIAEAEFYPSIAIGGSLVWSGNSLVAGESGPTLGIGPALSWNIFDWGRLENNVRIQDARLQQAIENYRATVINAAREINDAAIALSKTAEQRVLLEQTVVASDRSLELAQARYREGYAGFQRVLDAQRVVFTQADRKLQNDGAHLSAVVALFKSLGGGWRPDQLDTLLPATTREQMEQRTDWGDLLTIPVIDASGPPEPETESSP